MLKPSQRSFLTAIDRVGNAIVQSMIADASPSERMASAISTISQLTENPHFAGLPSTLREKIGSLAITCHSQWSANDYEKFSQDLLDLYFDLILSARESQPPR